MCYWTHGTRTRYGVTENNRLFYFIFLTFRSPSTRLAGLFDFVFWCCLNIFPRVGQRIKCVKRSGRHRCPLRNRVVLDEWRRSGIDWHGTWRPFIRSVRPPPPPVASIHCRRVPRKKKENEATWSLFVGTSSVSMGFGTLFRGITWVLLGLGRFYWVLLGSTEFYWVLSKF